MKYLLMLLTSLSILSCKGDDDACINVTQMDLSDCFSPISSLTDSVEEYYDLVVGQIEYDTTVDPIYSIQEGSRIVFVYRHVLGMDNVWIDDEFEERILFEIKDDVDAFTIEDQAEFIAANCTYGVCGAWHSGDTYQGFEGSITGVKTSECVWEIDADVMIEARNGVVGFLEVDS